MRARGILASQINNHDPCAKIMVMRMPGVNVTVTLRTITKLCTCAYVRDACTLNKHPCMKHYTAQHELIKTGERLRSGLTTCTSSCQASDAATPGFITSRKNHESWDWQIERGKVLKLCLESSSTRVRSSGNSINRTTSRYIMSKEK